MALLTADAKGTPRSSLCSFFHDFDRVKPFASFHLMVAFGIHLRSVVLYTDSKLQFRLYGRPAFRSRTDNHGLFRSGACGRHWFDLTLFSPRLGKPGRYRTQRVVDGYNCGSRLPRRSFMPSSSHLRTMTHSVTHAYHQAEPGTLSRTGRSLRLLT